MIRSVVPDFHGQVMAVERVEKLLQKVTQALDAVQIPYAVVGGNAVAAWVTTVDDGAVRATKDVDILIRQEDLTRITQQLWPLGLMPVEVLGVAMFVNRDNPNPKTGVHIVFANQRVRAHYTNPAPDVSQSIKSVLGYAVIDLPALVTMKLQSYRHIDRAHIIDLLSVGLIDESLVSQLPADLRQRLQEVKNEPQ